MNTSTGKKVITLIAIVFLITTILTNCKSNTSLSKSTMSQMLEEHTIKTWNSGEFQNFEITSLVECKVSDNARARGIVAAYDVDYTLESRSSSSNPWVKQSANKTFMYYKNDGWNIESGGYCP